MAQILSSQGDNEEVKAKVSALLAGTASSREGIHINKRDDIEQISYDVGGNITRYNTYSRKPL